MRKKIKKIIHLIKEFTTEKVGYLCLGNNGIINLSIDLKYNPTVVLDIVKKFSNRPTFLIESSQMAFSLNNYECISLFGEDLDTLQWKIENQQKLEYEEYLRTINDDEESEIQEIINNAKKQTVELNLDNILDKISSCGFESLSKKEKKYLENFGK